MLKLIKTAVLVAAIAITLSSNLPAQVVSVAASALPAGSAQPIYGWVRFPGYEVERPGIGSGPAWGYSGFYGVFGLRITGFSASFFGPIVVIAAPSAKTLSEPTQQAPPPSPSKVKSVTCEYHWPSTNQTTGSAVESEPRSNCR
jgi:hypothetical protein